LAIHPVDYYLPEKDKPAFYIFIYNKSKPPHLPRPNQILKADTWQECRQFAACFCSATNLQYVEATALSPKVDGAYETTRTEFWNEDGKVVFREWVLPAAAIKLLTEKYSCPVVEK
jgi:hypothetical protein